MPNYYVITQHILPLYIFLKEPLDLKELVKHLRNNMTRYSN